jgi:hypothetical protein
MCISTTTAARSDGHRAGSVWGAIVQLLTGCLLGQEEAHVPPFRVRAPGHRAAAVVSRHHDQGCSPWLSHRLPLSHEPLGGLVRLRGGPGLAPPGAVPPDPTRGSVDSVAPAERPLVAHAFRSATPDGLGSMTDLGARGSDGAITNAGISAILEAGARGEAACGSCQPQGDRPSRAAEANGASKGWSPCRRCGLPGGSCRRPEFWDERRDPAEVDPPPTTDRPIAGACPERNP